LVNASFAACMPRAEYGIDQFLNCRRPCSIFSMTIDINCQRLLLLYSAIQKRHNRRQRRGWAFLERHVPEPGQCDKFCMR
jgi:hypothetical protein